MDIHDNNEKTWNQNTYEAWIRRFGTPVELAVKLKKDPLVRLNPIYELMGDIKDKSIINLMGSNGAKAVALALLGARVKVIDFSAANKQYALELAAASSVNIEYVLSDVLNLPQKELKPQCQIAFAELGIIHYFTDLHPFFRVVHTVLEDGGIFILRDFHPVSTKLISSKGSTANVRKHKVTGDYFDTSLQEVDASYSKYIEEDKDSKESKALIRKWNLGEIITAIADEGFRIEYLREEPNLSSEVYDKGIPKTFTVVARK